MINIFAGKSVVTKRICMALLLAASLFILSGCDSAAYEELYNDDSLIAGSKDKHFYLVSISNGKDGELKQSFESFSGKDTIFEISSDDEGSVKLDYDIDIDMGKFKIVLIYPDNRVEEIVKDNEGTEELSVSQGKSKICILGVEAKGKIELDLHTAENCSYRRTKDD